MRHSITYISFFLSPVFLVFQLSIVPVYSLSRQQIKADKVFQLLLYENVFSNNYWLSLHNERWHN
jgi:hypothetical protein